ncbi:MAG: DUF3999 family protein [Methylobacter sp.]
MMLAKILLLVCLLSAQSHAEATAYRFSRAVVRQDDGSQALLVVTLDDAVYAASTDGFYDLRLSDQNGVETPYLLQKIADRKTAIRRVASPSETLDLQKTGADSISITASLAKDAVDADGLSIITEQHDFEYTLQIHGSDDNKAWQLLADNAVIYDYSRYMAIDKHDIALPPNRYRYFKIIVEKAGQTRTDELLELTRTLRGNEELQRSETSRLHNEPLHIERITFWHEETVTLPESERQFDYPVSAFKITQDTEHKTSLIDIDTARQPLTGFSLQSKTANFSRPAQVQIPRPYGNESPLQSLADATLKALHFNGINREQTTVTFPEQRQSRYRIVIDNQDNPPLEIDAVIGIGHGYQLLFLPQAGNHYRLQYGVDKAAAPHYDTAAIRELLRLGYAGTAAALGPEVPAALVADKPDIGLLLDSRLLLGIVITLMVLVLTWSLYRLGKRVGELPKE